MVKGDKQNNNSSGDTKLALYRKYRPTSLDQVIGQPQVTDVLTAAAKAGSFAHAYLFTGQRGTGKTTVARILAHLINGLNYSDNINSDNIDIIEIDAASNNGVDDVRQIRDSVQLAPMNCSHKVYIIDEFHMLSKPAFNALLKTIEEPPEYVVFILATTELQKVPATILSRVQRFHFKPLPPELLAKHLRYIADQEGIKADDDALLLIAKRGGGSVRDSITLLDQLSGSSHITVATVNDVLGLVSSDNVEELIDNVIAGNYQAVVGQVQAIIADGTSATALTKQLIASLQTKALADGQPQLFGLINQLLDVAKSSLPDAKLLACLISYNSYSAVIAKPVATSGSTKAKSTPSAKTEVKTSENKPMSTAESMSTTTERVVEDKAIANEQQVEAEAEAETETETEIAPTSDTDSAQDGDASQPAETASSDGGGNVDIAWDDVLQQLAVQDRPSTRSLVEKCDYRYNPDNQTLTLFFGRPFHRKQAKTKGFNDAMVATFQELYGFCPTIEISDESAPADSDVAAVLKLVGGEVTTISDGEI